MESRRHLILCCCRLSPEKEVENFVQLARQAAPVLRARGLVPVVVGYAQDEGYAESVLAPLREAFPGALRAPSAAPSRARERRPYPWCPLPGRRRRRL